MSHRNRGDEAGPARRDSASRGRPHGKPGERRRAGPTAAGPVLTVARDVLAAGMSHRPIDVICAGMYRACSTWQYEVVAHLVEHHRGGRRLGYLTPEEYVGPESPAAGPEGEEIPATGWRVIKSHDGHPCFARATGRGRAVVIYAYRDVRDVVFSLMHKRRWTFEQVLGRGMIHQVLANDRFWTRRHHVLIQRYEEILADPVGAVRALADHVGIRPAAGEAERLAEEYSLAANKARTESLRRQLEQGGVDLDQAASAWICDPATLLHWNHVRDGRSGSWRDEATPRQRFILRRLCGRWLESRGYPAGDEEAVRDASISMAERIGIEAAILRGWLAFRAHEAAQRHPRLAAAVKRRLGLADSSKVGATAWSDASSSAGSPLPKA